MQISKKTSSGSKLAMGLTVAEAENIGNSIPLAVAVRRFMEDNASKEPKTVAQYRHALNQFCESTRKLAGRDS